MEFVKLALLLASVLGAIKPPKGFSNWVIPSVFVSAGMLSNLITYTQFKTSTLDLGPAILFLLTVVPLAVLLDTIGFFKAAANFALNRKRLLFWLWLLAATTTALINLDASVVLLTPLYITLAREQMIDEKNIVIIPALLASLASGLLPISNLTNLILVDRFNLGSLYFLERMGVPVICAATVGFFLYRRKVTSPRQTKQPVQKKHIKPLIVGLVTVVILVIGFLVGPYFSIKEWQVALGADIILAFLCRKIPLKEIPVNTALLVLCLGPLTLSTISSLKSTSYFNNKSFIGLFALGIISVIGANLFNNLPTTLVAVSSLKPPLPKGVWPFLLGVDMGPSLLITGSLAAMLWLEIARDFNVKYQPIEYAKWGFTVTIPAFVISLLIICLELVLF
jgi:arsenical pump membrane protein